MGTCWIPPMYHEKNQKIMLIFMLGNTLEVGEFHKKVPFGGRFEGVALYIMSKTSWGNINLLWSE